MTIDERIRNIMIDVAAGIVGTETECRRAALRSLLEMEMDAVRYDTLAAARVHLMEIRAKARFEQERATGLHMTCLSLIEKEAQKALDAIGGTATIQE